MKHTVKRPKNGKGAIRCWQYGHYGNSELPTSIEREAKREKEKTTKSQIG